MLNGESTTSLVENEIVIAIFGTGAVIGLFTMAHVVRRALNRYRGATRAFLVSLMVGALRLPVEEVATNLGETAGNALSIALVAAVVGCGAVLVVDRYTDDLEYVN